MDWTLFGIALFAAIYYWFCSTVWGYTFTDAFFSPVVAAIPLGLLLGDLQTALIIGATIQLIYIGQINTGGNWPADECLAACIVIPLAINSNMSVELAAALAVPVSFLGVFIRNVLRGINTVFVHWADKHAEAGNEKGIHRCAFHWPMITSFALRVPPVFVVGYFGAALIDPVLAVIPEFIMHAFELAGGVLPALGIAMTITLIGKKNNFAFFFLAFFVVTYFEMDIMLSAIIGTCIALLMVFNQKKEGGTEGFNMKQGAGDKDAEEDKILNGKDINRLYFRWYMLCEVSNSFERLQSTAVCASYAPALKKLYAGQPEAYKESLSRNLQFFNTEGIFGSVIHGTAIAMEEEKATNPEIPGEMITSVKTGLMGPLAGIGDTITWGTLRPILFGLAASFAMQGSAFGGVLPFVFTVITYLIGRYLFRFGYKLGRGSVKNLLESGVVKDVILGAGVLGMFMMGAIAANYVDISTPLSFAAAGEEFAVQDMLDGIVKGILPLAMVMGTYTYLKKTGNKIIRALLIIVAICLVGSLLGIL